MQLTQPQESSVREWLAVDQKVSEIQERLAREFDVQLTYLETRMLISDLAPTRTMNVELSVPPGVAGASAGLGPEPLVASGNLTVAVDPTPRAGTMVSGTATFCDGHAVQWHLDDAGRFGLVSPKLGGQPSTGDLAELQILLDQELSKLGYNRQALPLPLDPAI